MAIYEFTSDNIQKIEESSFSAFGIKERSDLQRLLRERIDVVSPDTLVLSEEFGTWEDSRRRIDLLGLDQEANLVVIELKRGEDGGHMELQALRYAAMVSAMTFEQAVEAHAQYLNRWGHEEDARSRILEFLDWEEPDEKSFGQDVRLVLVSADFSKEMTTAVIWLNERALDIRCVRLKPYRLDERVLVDVQQIIPLPEAAEYQVKLREKQVRGHVARKEQSESATIHFRFWSELLNRARSRTNLHANVSPTKASWVATSSGVPGYLSYVVRQNDAHVELYIDVGHEAENKRIFDRLHAQKEKIESSFGDPLEWQRLDGKRACRIKWTIHAGGYRDAEDQWPEIHERMIDAMIRLEKALKPQLAELRQP